MAPKDANAACALACSIMDAPGNGMYMPSAYSIVKARRSCTCTPKVKGPTLEEGLPRRTSEKGTTSFHCLKSS